MTVFTVDVTVVIVHVAVGGGIYMTLRIEYTDRASYYIEMTI